MPNWITNKIKAPSHVIRSMLNDKGNIDFNLVTAFDGEFPWDGVRCDAETLAETVVRKPLSDNPLLQGLQAFNRNDTNIKKLSDESFEQFIQMLRNFRKCGFLHTMDFARDAWGTKWNACEPVANVEAGTASFETAWSCPRPVLEALSKKFPDDAIEVQFADEDIGSNCGMFTLKSGQYITSDIAPAWNDQTEEQKAKWKAFGYALKGWDAAAYEDDE